MYVAIVILFTLLIIGLLILCIKKKSKKRQDNDPTFMIGRPKGKTNDVPKTKTTNEIQTQTEQSAQSTHTGQSIQVHTDQSIQVHTGPRGERGLPGLPFQLNDCGNLTDGMLQLKVSELPNIPFYYYAVSKDLRTYKTELDQDMSYHLICLAKGQWFDLGPYTAFSVPPAFLNVRSFDQNQTSFQVPDNVFHVKYQLWKPQGYIEGIMDVHPGQLINMNNYEIEGRDVQNAVQFELPNTNVSRIVLWY